MTSRSDHLCFLPHEVWHSSVLSLLSLKELSCLDIAIINRAMHGEFCKWVRNVAINEFCLSQSMTDSQLVWMAKHKVQICRLQTGCDVNEACLLRFSSHVLRVKNVAISFCEGLQDKAVLDFLSKLNGVQTIVIFFMKEFHDAASFTAMLNRHPCLAELRFCYNNFTQPEATLRFVRDITQHCDVLISLDLDYNSLADDEFVIYLAEHSPKLSYLSLRGCTRLTDASLLALSRHCVQLQSLSLAADSRGGVTDAGLVPLLQRCSRLEVPHIWDWSGVSEVSLAALAATRSKATALRIPRCRALDSGVAEQALLQFRCLQFLDLRYGSNVRCALLIEIVQNNPALHGIHLNEIAAVSDYVLAVIADTCPALRTLSISGCASVTDLTPLRRCTNLLGLQMIGCTGVADATLLQLAATPGRRMLMHAHGSGVSNACAAALAGSARIQLCFDHTMSW